MAHKGHPVSPAPVTHTCQVTLRRASVRMGHNELQLQHVIMILYLHVKHLEHLLQRCTLHYRYSCCLPLRHQGRRSTAPSDHWLFCICMFCCACLKPEPVPALPLCIAEAQFSICNLCRLQKFEYGDRQQSASTTTCLAISRAR